HLNGVVIHLAVTSRLEIEDVLVAGFFSNLGIELREAILLRAEVNVAAGIVCIADQTVELAVEIGATSSHAVDGNLLFQKFRTHLVIGMNIELRSVLPVGDEQDNLSAVAARTL